MARAHTPQAPRPGGNKAAATTKSVSSDTFSDRALDDATMGDKAARDVEIRGTGSAGWHDARAYPLRSRIIR